VAIRSGIGRQWFNAWWCAENGRQRV